MEQWTTYERKEEKFLQILSEGHPDDKIYIYWMQNGKHIKPAILISGTPFEDLHDFLRQEYGAHRYLVMIRRGKEMLLRHEIGIAVPFNHVARKDIRLEIEKLRRAKRKNDTENES